MSLLLDSHIALAIAQQSLARKYPRIAAALAEDPAPRHVSVASLWELAIKTRLGKLDLGIKLPAFAAYLEAYGLRLLPVQVSHAIAAPSPDPPTRDPFDRMLLAQCAVEGMRLVTVDRALADHPLAWPVAKAGEGRSGA